MVSALVDTFVDRAVGSGAEIHKCTSLDEAAAFVNRFLQENGQEKLAISPDAQCVLPESNRLPFVAPAKKEDYLDVEAGLVLADYGVASTGTLVHLDRNEKEKIAWTLPSVCFCVLNSRQIVGELEELSAILFNHLGDDGAELTHVSLVTGPSRTADIEGQLTLGVQGPKRLIILLIKEE